MYVDENAARACALELWCVAILLYLGHLLLGNLLPPPPPSPLPPPLVFLTT
jgi:hypothetical protein